MPDRARGLIFRFDFDAFFPSGPLAGEPDNERFVVVVSPDRMNRRLSTSIIAPTTASQVDSRSEVDSNVVLLPGRTATGITAKCVVQLHLLYALNPDRLGLSVGQVTDPDTLDEIAYPMQLSR
jgi:mRNA-degrading endonuclease toxin of MazEF toxin-antitoxin module